MYPSAYASMRSLASPRSALIRSIGLNFALMGMDASAERSSSARLRAFNSPVRWSSSDASSLPGGRSNFRMRLKPARGGRNNLAGQAYHRDNSQASAPIRAQGSQDRAGERVIAAMFRCRP